MFFLLRKLVMTCSTSSSTKLLLNVEYSNHGSALNYINFLFNFLLIKFLKELIIEYQIMGHDLHEPYSSKLWLCRQTARQISQKCTMWVSSQTDMPSIWMTCHHSFSLLLLPSYARASRTAKISPFLTNVSHGNELWDWEQAVYVQTPGPQIKDTVQ